MTALCLTSSRISLFTARATPTWSRSPSRSHSRCCCRSAYSSGGFSACVAVCAALCHSLTFIYKDVSFISLAFFLPKNACKLCDYCKWTKYVQSRWLSLFLDPPHTLSITLFFPLCPTQTLLLSSSIHAASDGHVRNFNRFLCQMSSKCLHPVSPPFRPSLQPSQALL